MSVSVAAPSSIQVHLLGFSWAGADEGKMRSTFGVGAKDFGRFLDLQLVAQGLGYHGFGLARLTRQVRDGLQSRGCVRQAGSA